MLQSQHQSGGADKLTPLERIANRIDKDIEQKKQMLELDKKHKSYYDGALASLRYMKFFVSQLLNEQL